MRRSGGRLCPHGSPPEAPSGANPSRWTHNSRADSPPWPTRPMGSAAEIWLWSSHVSPWPQLFNSTEDRPYPQILLLWSSFSVRVFGGNKQPHRPKRRPHQVLAFPFRFWCWTWGTGCALCPTHFHRCISNCQRRIGTNFLSDIYLRFVQPESFVGMDPPISATFRVAAREKLESRGQIASQVLATCLHQRKCGVNARQWTRRIRPILVCGFLKQATGSVTPEKKNVQICYYDHFLWEPLQAGTQWRGKTNGRMKEIHSPGPAPLIREFPLPSCWHKLKKVQISHSTSTTPTPVLNKES